MVSRISSSFLFSCFIVIQFLSGWGLLLTYVLSFHWLNPSIYMCANMFMYLIFVEEIYSFYDNGELLLSLISSKVRYLEQINKGRFSFLFFFLHSLLVFVPVNVSPIYLGVNCYNENLRDDADNNYKVVQTNATWLRTALAGNAQPHVLK